MDAVTLCPVCGATFGHGTGPCAACGSSLTPCGTCGRPLLATDRYCGECGSAQGAPVDESPWTEVLERLRAATVGEFVVQGELGRGGMATVFRAHEIALDRKVAIKVMAPGLLMGSGMIERFRQEAITVANLHHPNIVTIHAVRQAQGLHFFVMRLVEGRSLERVIRDRGPLPVDVVRAWLFQVGGALGYAHRRGIVHRDIKPANILLDEHGDAVVTDFGIAKVASAPGLTMTGATVGTPAYMSPEQCWSRELSGASDQYSLGIVAYEMLTGAPPFSGNTLSVLRAHTEDAPPPLAAVRPDCPSDLRAAVERMLAKDAGARFATIVEAVTVAGGNPPSDEGALRDELELLARPDGRDPVPPMLPTPRSPIPRTTAPPPAPPPAPVLGPPTPVPPPATTQDPARSTTTPRGSFPLADPRKPTFPLAPRPKRRRGVRMLIALPLVAAAAWLLAGRPTRLPSYGSVYGRSAAGISRSVPPPLPNASERKRGLRADSGRRAATDHTAPSATSGAVASLLLSPPPARIAVGDSFTLKAAPLDSAGTLIALRRVVWRSDRPDIASVSAAGRVTARAPGSAIVTATAGGRAFTLRLSVVAPAAIAAPAPAGSPAPPAPISSPAASSSGATAIAAGGSGSCALAASGTLVCWGDGRAQPSPLETGARLTRIVMGDNFGCGLAADGRAYCWGSNGKGQLGDGTTKGHARPALVTADLAFADLSTGQSHACGITSGGNLYCWGANGAGQLGDGTRDGRLRPTQIKEAQPWKQVAAGGSHTCAIARSGTTYCWGDGFSGQLGQGILQNELEPVPVAGGHSFRRIAAGERHTCGIGTDGRTYCWGDNRAGQLGDGTRGDEMRPVPIEGAFDDISTGRSHTCALSNGRGLCWGANDKGQLGDGTLRGRTTPGPVASSDRFTHIAAGAAHTCAVSAAGLRCWGAGDRGQLSVAAQATSVPTAVSLGGTE